jgi:hypothetical protein
MLVASEDLDLGDLTGAEHNRQLARDNFISGSAAFRKLQLATGLVDGAVP